MKKGIGILVVVMMIMIAACGKPETTDSANKAVHEQHAEQQMPNGDLRVMTSSVTEAPSFLEGKMPELRQVYMLVGEHTELLRYIPCYCGCGESAGHESNLNCFIHKVAEDGETVWDDHGTRCDVCLSIALQSIKMEEEGMSVKDIRHTIDEAYKTGYAKATPTVMPE